MYRIIVILIGLAFCMPVWGASQAGSDCTWVAQEPANGMQNAAHWSTNTIPTTADTAIFDSTITNIATNPHNQIAPFSVFNLLFTNDASPFLFSFINQSLAFSGNGIIGTNTDTTIDASNTNNTSLLAYQIYFSGSNNTSGSAFLNATNSTDQWIACKVDTQISSAGAFSVLNGGYLSACNSGAVTNLGAPMLFAGVVSTSQILFENSLTVGNNCEIDVCNSGSIDLDGSSSTTIGYVGNQQLQVTGAFIAGDWFTLYADNEGIDSGVNSDANYIGALNGKAQVEIDGNCTLGDNAYVALSNTGTAVNFNTSGSYVGCLMNGYQFFAGSNFQAGDNFTLDVANVGYDFGLGGTNQSHIAWVAHDSIHFDSTCALGDNAWIYAYNSGVYGGVNLLSGNRVSTVEGQFFAGEEFSAGDFLTIAAVNFAYDTSAGRGNNAVGLVHDQLQFGSSCSLGDSAAFIVANGGSYIGSNVSLPNNVGVIDNYQFSCLGPLTAGQNLDLEIINIANCDTTGTGNQVGTLANSQLSLANGCTLGDNAYIDVENTAFSLSIGTLNTVGCVNGPQASITGDFVAGNNLEMTVSNKAYVYGDTNNNVGVVSGSQVVFENAFKVGDGSLLSVYNNGTVQNSQILFKQGFEILNGKATIEAINDGSLGFEGITILGNSLGGNANISLANNALLVETLLPTFTIGELNGNNACTVRSKPSLLINTDAGTIGNFSGVIEDYPGMASTLVKQGPGTQILEGNNTYTGLTIVDEGILILTGTVAGDVTTSPLGVLKGNGIVAGNVFNFGTVSPGQSIGTLSIQGDFINNGSNYLVEVNGAGQSDLLLVNGTAALNGGTVVVDLGDGTYQFQTPYTILTASNVVGTFGSAAALSPLLAPRLLYDPNNVYLILGSAFINAARTHNQRVVAQQLDGIPAPTAGQNLLISQLLGLPFSNVRDALDSLSGYQHTDDLWITQMISHQFVRRLYDPLRSLVTSCDCDPCVCGWTGWLEAEGGATRINGTHNAHGLRIHDYDVTAGTQTTFDRYLTAGIAGSYKYSDVHYGHGSSGKNSTWLAGLYALYRPSCYYGLVDLGFGYSSNAIDRAIHAGALHYKAHSKPKVSQLLLYGECGVDYETSCFLVQPFLGLEIGQHWRHRVREHQKQGWGLKLKQKDWFTASSRLGVHITGVFSTVDVSLDLAWNRLLTTRANRINGRFIEFGDDFSIHGIPLSSDSLDYALTISRPFCSCLDAYLEIAGETWKHATNYSLLGGLELAW